MLSDEEANELLRKLREHFHEPVLPLSRVCSALTTWSEASGDHLPLTAIRKSNLLFRMLFLGEPLRTTPCPTHKGKWSGCKELGTCDCQCGWDVTGWLPNEPRTEQQEIDAMREAPVRIVNLCVDPSGAGS